MQPLRQARFLARLVLAWFALALGVAIASPLVKPQGFELVCTGGGPMKLMAKGADGAPVAQAAALDCPLCASLDVPPLATPLAGPLVQPLAQAVQPIPAARIAALVAAPPPARGPPASLKS